MAYVHDILCDIDEVQNLDTRDQWTKKHGNQHFPMKCPVTNPKYKSKRLNVVYTAMRMQSDASRGIAVTAALATLVFV